MQTSRLCGTDYDDITEYSYWYAVFLNNHWEEGFRRLRTKEDAVSIQILQNPSDPDATYRSKAGKEHQGYVANFEETVDKWFVITDYQFEQKFTVTAVF